MCCIGTADLWPLFGHLTNSRQRNTKRDRESERKREGVRSMESVSCVRLFDLCALWWHSLVASRQPQSAAVHHEGHASHTRCCSKSFHIFSYELLAPLWRVCIDDLCDILYLLWHFYCDNAFPIRLLRLGFIISCRPLPVIRAVQESLSTTGFKKCHHFISKY